MICSSCQSIYPATNEELGTVESLSGLCETCGSEPRWKQFSRSFIEGAIGGAISMEIFVLLLFLDDWHYAIYLPIVVAVICAAVYVLCNRSPIVHYQSEEQRKDATRGQRILGIVTGFAVGAGVLSAFIAMRY